MPKDPYKFYECIAYRGDIPSEYKEEYSILTSDKPTKIIIDLRIRSPKDRFYYAVLDPPSLYTDSRHFYINKAVDSSKYIALVKSSDDDVYPALMRYEDRYDNLRSQINSISKWCIRVRVQIFPNYFIYNRPDSNRPCDVDEIDSFHRRDIKCFAYIDIQSKDWDFIVSQLRNNASSNLTYFRNAYVLIPKEGGIGRVVSFDDVETLNSYRNIEKEVDRKDRILTSNYNSISSFPMKTSLRANNKMSKNEIKKMTYDWDSIYHPFVELKEVLRRAQEKSEKGHRLLQAQHYDPESDTCPY